MSLPLQGVRIVELAGIGPVPHACMVLADLGADVVRVDRPGPTRDPRSQVLRGRRIVTADLKDAAQRDDVAALAERADVFVEGYRPGVVERLGLGPEHLVPRNERLVYGRMTGWGQDGPWAHTAGHDINYIGLTGALHGFGDGDHPVPALNLVGDYGGGSMHLVTGVLAALVERATTGRGRLVEAAILDGTSTLLASVLQLRAQGEWSDARASNVLDGAAPYYRTYRCRDGGFMAVGAIEPQFYDQLVRLLGLDPATLPQQDDRARWAELTERIASVFAGESRAHWEAVFAGTDACTTPVLTFGEAPHHPQVAARGALVVDDRDAVVSGISPRFAPVLGAQPTPRGPTEPAVRADLTDVLSAWTGGGTDDAVVR